MIKIPISREELEKKRDLLYRHKGIEIKGDDAEVDHDGIIVKFSYDGEYVTADILKVPLKYRMFRWKIEKEITDWFRGEDV